MGTAGSGEEGEASSSEEEAVSGSEEGAKAVARGMKKQAVSKMME